MQIYPCGIEARKFVKSNVIQKCNSQDAKYLIIISKTDHNIRPKAERPYYKRFSDRGVKVIWLLDVDFAKKLEKAILQESNKFGLYIPKGLSVEEMQEIKTVFQRFLGRNKQDDPAFMPIKTYRGKKPSTFEGRRICGKRIIKTELINREVLDELVFEFTAFYKTGVVIFIYEKGFNTFALAVYERCKQKSVKKQKEIDAAFDGITFNKKTFPCVICNTNRAIAQGWPCLTCMRR